MTRHDNPVSAAAWNQFQLLQAKGEEPESAFEEAVTSAISHQSLDFGDLGGMGTPSREGPTGRLCYSEKDLDRLGVLSRKTRYRLRREGRFPEPVQAAPGRKLYRAVDIHAWLRDPESWAEEREAEAS